MPIEEANIYQDYMFDKNASDEEDPEYIRRKAH